MRNRTSMVIVLAVVLIAFATVVVASTLSAAGGATAHSMPDGNSMEGAAMP